jgi:hypothetical protein
LLERDEFHHSIVLLDLFMFCAEAAGVFPTMNG